MIYSKIHFKRKTFSMIYIKAYIGVLIVFLILDALWLGLLAKNLYNSQLGELMRENPNMLAAGLFYAVYVGGIVFFAVQPALNTAFWWTAAWHGALLGLLAYGTFAVTNYAVLKAWSLNLVIADTLWGIILTAVAAAGGFLATRVNF